MANGITSPTGARLTAGQLGASALLLALALTRRTAPARAPDIPAPAAPAQALAPSAPRRWPGLWAFLKLVKAEVDDDRVFMVAAGVTLYAVFALVPTITAFVALYGLFADRASAAGHLAALSTFMPAEALALLKTEVDRLTSVDDTTLGLASLIGFALALWGARGGVSGVMEAMNVAYDTVERRSFVKRTLVALSLAALALCLLVGLILAGTLLPALLKFLPGSAVLDTLLLVARWPVMFAGLILALAVLYAYGPDRPDARFRWISPGAIVAASVLMLGSAAFAFYTSRFAVYGESYGPLGAAVALMMWLWIGSIVILVGAEINAELDALSRPAVPQDPLAKAIG